MKLTIQIKDHKAAFFLELLRSFDDFVIVEKAEEIQDSELREEHKAILDSRLATYESDPAVLLAWEDVHTELKKP